MQLSRFGLLRSTSKSSLWNTHVESSVSLIARQKSSTVDAIKEENANVTNYDQALPLSSMPGPRGLPVIGSWLDYKLHPEKINQRHIYLKQVHEKYGGIAKEVLPGNTIVLLSSPEYIKQVYENEGKHPIIPPLLSYVQSYRKEREMAPGLGFSNGEEWYKLRAVVQQIIVKPQKALDYLYLQNDVADEFVDKLESILKEDGEVDDLNRWVYRWGLESSVYSFFEMKMGYFQDSGMAVADELIDHNIDVFKLSTQLYFSLNFQKYLPSPSVKKLFDHEDSVAAHSKKLLNMASKEFWDELEGRTKTGKKYLFLSFVLGSKSITASEVWSVVISLLNDTLSTTSQALLFNLYTLASNPEAQEKAYQEAMTILPESGELTAKGFNSCNYIKACIKETFRFYPVGLDVQRLCPADMVIGGYQVPKGTFLNMVNYAPLLDPEIIPNPELFLPERWVRGSDCYIKPQRFNLIPFSVGTRMCAGRRFAEQELVMLIAKILRRFKLEWHHDELSQLFRMLQIPDREVRVKFIPRKG